MKIANYDIISREDLQALFEEQERTEREFVKYMWRLLCEDGSVYNIWHAGLYVGNGIFIHSPHSGQVVSTQALSDTYGMRLVAARRIA